MNINSYEQLIVFLSNLKDGKYLEFNKKIIKTNLSMLGIRVPVIKKLAKDISKRDYNKILSLIKNKYYEEVLLEGFIISMINDKSFDKLLNSFISKIDNWAICDLCIGNMKRMRGEEKYFDLAYKYIRDTKEFIIRSGYIIILFHFLDEKHIDKILQILNENNTYDYYYVNMAKAWLVCECYIKFKEKTLNFLLNNNLDKYTHNIAIQKIKDSYRVNIEDKVKLNDLKKQ